MRSLQGRFALVTGGNRGIGREIALAMARAGASVAIAGRDSRSLSTTSLEVEQCGVRCLPVTCDVASAPSVEEMGRRVLSHFDHVDVVVANAGSTGPIKPLHLIEPSEWRDCVAVNLDGTYLTFRRFIPGMLARRAGSLIAISSASGKRPTRDRSPYAAAKLGVIGLVRGLGLELGPYGIRVNSVCPGVVEGARLSAVSEAEAAAEGVTTEEIRGRYVARSPLGRLVDAVEVARACVFLASDDASAITGEDLNVSAGALMY